MNKRFVKEKATEFIKVIAFILLFLLVVEGVSIGFFSEATATRYNNSKKDAYSFINEQFYSIQIVGVGNSDLYSGFSPLAMWKDYRITSLVSAAPRQTLQESYSLLEMIFESQNPQLVIIETDMFYDHNPESDNSIREQDRLASLFDRLDPDFFTHEVENVFSVFKFHNYWKGGDSKESNIPYNTHGYRFNNTVYRLKKTKYMTKTNKLEQLSGFNKSQMDKLIELCRAKGADVLLLEMPSISSWNCERHNAVMNYSKERNVPFVDLNFHYDDIGINMTNCFRDKGNHLNHAGAVATTNFICKYIKENYQIEKQKDKTICKSWDEDLKKFERFVKWTEQQKKKKSKQVAEHGEFKRN